MKKWRKVMIGIVLWAIPLYCGLSFWVTASPTGEDYYYLYYRPTRSEDSLALAFTVALRRNHPRAYQFTVPELHARLDEWMKTHEPRFCQWPSYLALGTGNTRRGYHVIYVCLQTDPNIYNYSIEVDTIMMENGKITNWGKAIEDFSRK